MQRFFLLGSLLAMIAFVGCGSKTSPLSDSEKVSTVEQDTDAKNQTLDLPAKASDGNHSETAVAKASQVAVAEITDFEEREKPKKEKSKSSEKKTKPAPTPTAEQLAKWAVPDFKPLRLVACYDNIVGSLVDAMAVSPDGKQFALGGVQLTLWNTSEPEPVIDLIADLTGEEIERPLRSVAYSPGGQWLAAGDHKGMLRIWSLSDKKLVHSIRAHDARLIQLAFSPNSKILATTSYSGDVSIWQVEDAKKVKTIKMSSNEIQQMVFISDQQLVTAGSEACIWNIESEQKETALTAKNTVDQALGISRKQGLLAFTNSESQVQFWDIQTAKAKDEERLYGGAGGTIAFSDDGNWVAATSSDYTIRIWDVKSRRTVQVIDADGGRTVNLAWLPNSRSLIIASEIGRVRIWGDDETAKAYQLTPIDLPDLTANETDVKKPLTSAQLQNVIDVRSFPTLPGAVPLWTQFFGYSYSAPCSQAEAELFYRYFLGQAGWEEAAETIPGMPGLGFRKNGCELNVSFSPSSGLPGSKPGDLMISLNFAGNYDVRWLPKHAPSESNATYGFFSSAAYRTKSTLTDVEVALLKKFHELGWTGYSRLAASTNEDPLSRTFTMLQGGEELTVAIGYPADSAEELFVQTSVSVKNKSLPVPPDAGWIEFDSSTNLQLVANTRMQLEETISFYDQQMALEGWLARKKFQSDDKQKVFLQYIQGQRDVLIRLVTLPSMRTRIIVGDADSTSWQLATPPEINPENASKGIEAADFKIPGVATAIKFDVDSKQIQFDVPKIKPIELADQYTKQFESLGWKRDSSGVVSDEYVLATFQKGKTEIDVRVRLVENQNSSAIIGGDGLLWSKPLPAAPVRVSYGTWLRRDRREASLDLLDEFEQAMKAIEPSKPK